MTEPSLPREYGLERGKVFPAAKARSLLNPARRLVQSPRRTVAAMRVAPDATVLEIGCGPGYFSPSVARAVPQGRAVMFDLQEEMLRLARERLSDLSNASLVGGDASVLPFRDASFDGVLVVAMLGEVPDRNGCLYEIRRVLRPGGIVAIAETRRDSDFITLETLRVVVGEHGLAYIDRRGPHWQYVARFRAV